MAREARRERTLLLSLDSSRLRQKELETQQALLQNRLREMEESRAFRTQGLLLPPPETSSTPDLDRALGLSTPTL